MWLHSVPFCRVFSWTSMNISDARDQEGTVHPSSTLTHGSCPSKPAPAQGKIPLPPPVRIRLSGVALGCCLPVLPRPRASVSPRCPVPRPPLLPPASLAPPPLALSGAACRSPSWALRFQTDSLLGGPSSQLSWKPSGWCSGRQPPTVWPRPLAIRPSSPGRTVSLSCSSLWPSAFVSVWAVCFPSRPPLGLNLDDASSYVSSPPAEITFPFFSSVQPVTLSTCVCACSWCPPLGQQTLKGERSLLFAVISQGLEP